MRYAMILAVLAGLAVAAQTSLTSASQRVMGPVMMVAISGFVTGFSALAVALFLPRPEFTARAVWYTLVSGVLGAFIVGSIAYAAGQGGVARALSLVIASQLIFGLVFDAFGLFGTGAELSWPKVLGVTLILVGGVLVILDPRDFVRF